MKILRVGDKIIKYIFFKISFFYSWIVSFFKFLVNGIEFNYDFVARGIPIVNVNLRGTFKIGKQFMFNSGKYYNMIGRQQRCYFIVGKDARLTIGDNVGISCSAIICYKQIVIGNDVRIGGGVVIYDTDFHSLNYNERTSFPEKLDNVQTASVEIKDGAFVGAHTIILKGVTIGSKSIVGAGSVVAKSIPDNEIWAGNPAKFLKKIL